MVIAIVKEEIISFRSGLKSLTLHCHSGHVWVTVSGSQTDYILSPGEELTVPRRSRIVIVAQEHSSLRLWHPLATGTVMGMGHFLSLSKISPVHGSIRPPLTVKRT